MTTTDMIVDEAERLQARVRELEAAALATRPYLMHVGHTTVFGVSGFAALARLDAALTPSEPRR